MKVDDQSMNTPSLRIIHMSTWYVFSLTGSLKLPYFCIFSPHLSQRNKPSMRIYSCDDLTELKPDLTELKPELFAQT